MEPIRRLRVFAGPNGSGKTTIIKELIKKISFGPYVNADDIENQLKLHRRIPLDNYQLASNTSEIQDFFKASTFAPIKLAIPDLWKVFTIEHNQLVIDETININSYIAADFADFLRNQLLKKGLSFSYETVLSHPEKIRFIKKAKDQGYRVYLYFIATDDPVININRVNIRVAQDGHFVPPEIITSRYYRSLENLKDAVLLSSRAYLFDNSGQVSKLLAEVTDGKEVKVIDSSALSNWFVTYLVNK